MKLNVKKNELHDLHEPSVVILLFHKAVKPVFKEHVTKLKSDISAF